MIIKIVHFLLSQKKKNDLPSQTGRLHKVQGMDNHEGVIAPSSVMMQTGLDAPVTVLRMVMAAHLVVVRSPRSLA